MRVCSVSAKKCDNTSKCIEPVWKNIEVKVNTDLQTLSGMQVSITFSSDWHRAK